MPHRRREVAPRRPPSQERALATVEAILAAAAAVFTESGYAAGTTNRIAARAGVSIGSLYEYFSDKDAILLALLRRHLDEGRAIVEEIEGRVRKRPEDLAGALRCFVDGVLRLHVRNPALHHVFFEEVPRTGEVRRAFGEIVRGLATALTPAIRAGGRPEVRRDARRTADVVVTVVAAVIHRFVLHPRHGGPDWIGDEVTALVMRYLQ